MQSEQITSSTSGSFQAKPRGEIQTVYVGNLGANVDRDTLSEAFSALNLDVRKVNILTND